MISKSLSILMLIFAIGFNLGLYRLEPTATIDPNDNPFQFALVDRTNRIWDFSARTCAGKLTYPVCVAGYLVDHWVPNWAQGYNLPFYYSHLPQIAIVASYKILPENSISLFQYYHFIIYLLLCFFPLPVFWALRVIRLPWFVAGIGALLATHLSTDGLYGLDPPSFLWRGYGLSSQLFAMIWLPLALAYAWKYFQNFSSSKGGVGRQFIGQLKICAPAILFTTLTTAGHLGVGIMTLMSIGVLAVSQPMFLLLQKSSIRKMIQSLVSNLYKLFFLAGATVFFLSYWIVPLLLNNNYHNISFWDPVWKFDSYGAKEILTNLFNGALFDFGRFPWLTILTLIGVFAAFSPKNQQQNKNSASNHEPFAVLFIFWLLVYFGRPTWGGLIDLIPGMKEFHLSRFIVGLHISSIFLAPIGINWFSTVLTQKITGWLATVLTEDKFAQISGRLTTGLYYSIFGLILLIIVPPVWRQTIKYNQLNDELILRANTNHTTVKSDEQELFKSLRQLPAGRIFAGRGGGFGKKFRVAETPYFMHLSTYGLPTTLWLPETWSPNSDVEQYFSEDQVRDYALFGIRWVAAPPDEPAQPFWQLLKETKSWKLYEIPGITYFTSGIRPAVVAADKQSFINLVRLWIQTDQTHARGLYPELSFNLKDYPKPTGLPNFRMLDEANYIVPDGSTHNIFAEPPVYLPQGITSIEKFRETTIEKYSNIKITNEQTNSDMIFTANAEVTHPCDECIVVLKQTYHPNWQATIDGKPVGTFTVFPFFIGIKLDTPGNHTIRLAYEPSPLKINLMIVTFVVTIIFLAWFILIPR